MPSVLRNSEPLRQYTGMIANTDDQISLQHRTCPPAVIKIEHFSGMGKQFVALALPYRTQNEIIYISLGIFNSYNFVAFQNFVTIRFRL